MSDQAILTEDRDGILVITINRPDARNAVNGDVANGMAEALDRLDSEDDLRVGIVTGAGGYFSAGMDLKAFVQGQTPYVGDRGFAGIAQRSSRKPLIAAVEGFALAGGFAIELAQQIVKNAPLALIASKEILQKAVDWTEDEGWAKQGEISGPVFTSEDAREGATAFAEKREPVWRGR